MTSCTKPLYSYMYIYIAHLVQQRHKWEKVIVNFSKVSILKICILYRTNIGTYLLIILREKQNNLRTCENSTFTFFHFLVISAMSDKIINIYINSLDVFISYFKSYARDYLIIY